MNKVELREALVGHADWLEMVGAAEGRTTIPLLRSAAAALERLEELEADNKRLRRGLENALIHTARLPHAPRDLLEGLLASVTRICKAALSMDAASTPAPAPQQGRDG